MFKIFSIFFSNNFNLLEEMYYGNEDPKEHVEQYNDYMEILGVSNALKCRVFPINLKSHAKSWYSSLPTRSIYNFSELKDLFARHFLASKDVGKTKTSLLGVKQEKKESIRALVLQHDNGGVSMSDGQLGCTSLHYRLVTQLPQIYLKAKVT